MARVTKQLQKLVDDYKKAGQPWPASATDMAKWAINNHRWFPQPAALISQCADQLSRAMREEHIVDPQGRLVRAKHMARVHKNGELVSLWDDIRSENRQHMAIAFQQRRQQIVGDCRQLKTDMDSYNDNASKDRPIQMVFDFTRDLEELGAVSNLENSAYVSASSFS